MKEAVRGAFLLVVLAACSSAEPAAPTATAVTSADAGGVDAGATCPTTREAETTAPLASAEIAEPSGIAASTLNPGVFWTHNDSGDSARAFAVDRSGALVTTLVFDTAPAVDIEDMATDGTYLYFADIGDNAVARSEYVIHRVREPRVGEPTITVASEKMTFHYVDGAHNAETLLFDPVSKDLFVATKVVFGNAAIHRVGPFTAGATVTTTRIAGVPIALATGGAISADGSLVAIRNYSTSAWLWRRGAREDLTSVFARTACKVPLATETQGEAFAFFNDNSGYVTLSEGVHEPLHVTKFQ